MDKLTCSIWRLALYLPFLCWLLDWILQLEIKGPSFDNFGGILCGTILTYYNVKILGDAHNDNFFPMFQTGSGKAVLFSKDSIQKARAVLEGRK